MQKLFGGYGLLEFNVSNQVENFLKYNQIIYDFNFKQQIDCKTTKKYKGWDTILHQDVDKYKIETPLLLLLKAIRKDDRRITQWNEKQRNAVYKMFKLILSHKPNISQEYTMFQFGECDEKCSLMEEVFNVFCNPDDDAREILSLFMDCSKDLAFDLFDYISPTTHTNIFINVLNQTCGAENPTVLLQNMFKKLFIMYDGNKNNNKNNSDVGNKNARKIWQLLDQKCGKKKYEASAYEC